MQDGIIKGTGNSRYLKSVANFLSLYPTYEAFAAALIAGELPIDLNGINEAGWQQLATALNKANLLSDETAAALGDVNTPDEAFMALVDKVGTIRLTMRTDLGDKWLLANGATISEEQYPELFQLLYTGEPNGDFDITYLGDSASGDTAHAYKILYGNGQYAICQDSRLLYSASPSGPWTGTSAPHTYTSRIIFSEADNCFVMAADSKIYWTTSIGDSWSSSTVTYPGDGTYTAVSTQWYSVKYVNGMYILCGMTSMPTSSYPSTAIRHALIAYSGSLNGPWSFKTLWNQVSSSYTGSCENYAMSVAYGNGYYVVVGSTKLYNSTGYTYDQTKIARATTLGGTWTIGTDYSTTAPSGASYVSRANLTDVEYVKGHFIACRVVKDNSSQSYSEAYLLRTKDNVIPPTSGWSQYSLWWPYGDGDTLKTNNRNPVWLNVCNGWIILSGQGRTNTDTNFKTRMVYMKDDVMSLISREDLWGGEINASDNTLANVIYNDDKYITCGINYSSSGTILGLTAYIDDSTCSLPEVSVDGAYCYIKASEV